MIHSTSCGIVGDIWSAYTDAFKNSTLQWQVHLILKCHDCQRKNNVLTHFHQGVMMFVKEMFYHNNHDNYKLWEWWNEKKNILKINWNILLDICNLWIILLMKKLWYTDLCNFLTKCALVGQKSMLVFAKASNIFHYLNLLDYPCCQIIHTQHGCSSQMNYIFWRLALPI